VKTSGKLLLIDTTGVQLLVALITKDGMQTRTNDDQRRHSESLNDIVGDWVQIADAFAVVTGPGSWTGSRVGVVAVKAWAFATGKPVIALTGGIDGAWEKFQKKEFTQIKNLAPKYDAEFKVTLKNS